MNNFLKTFFEKKSHQIIAIVLGVLVLVVILLCILLQDHTYVMYRDIEGKLYAYDGDSTLVSDNASTMYVLFGTHKKRYALYKQNEALYLYDNRQKKSTQLMEYVNNYQFTANDSYVLILNENSDLYSYDYKNEPCLLDNTIDSIVDVTNDRLLYQKNGSLYVVSANPNRNDRTLISENVDTAQFSENGSQIVYTTTDSMLHIYSIGSQKDVITYENVYQVNCDDSSCNHFYYLTDNGSVDLYYASGSKSYLIEEGLMNVLYTDASSKRTIYSKVESGNVSLYYNQSGKESLISSSFGFGDVYTTKNGYYYTDDSQNLYYVGYGSTSSKQLQENYSGTMIQTKSYLAYAIDDNFTILHNASLKSLNHSIQLDTLQEEGSSLYYLDDSNTLYRYQNKEVSITDSVKKFAVLDGVAYSLKKEEDSTGYSFYQNDKLIVSHVQELVVPCEEDN